MAEDGLKKLHTEKKKEITRRLKEFKRTGELPGKELFAEMCFCILTPQSRALAADIAIKKMIANGILYKGAVPDVRKYLHGVRFPNNKARYIIDTRKRFTSNGRLRIKDFLREEDTVLLRDKLKKIVMGYGLKEASHFLRNTGRGADVAILDRHILKELKKYGVIDAIPESIGRGQYIEIEDKMRKFSAMINIPMDALDLLLWYKETGYFFK